MMITRQALLSAGFEEKPTEYGMCYAKGHMALVYSIFGWIPCYYAAGTTMADRLHIETMEELERLIQEGQ